MKKSRNPQWGYQGRTTPNTGPVSVCGLSAMGTPDHEPVGGILLEVQALCPPASSVFTPAEMDERLARIAARVEADLAAIAAEQALIGPDRPARKARSTCLAKVKVVSCAGCGRELLAASEEPNRRNWKRSRTRLPPPIALLAGRQEAAPEGRPYCSGCLDSPVKPVVLLKSRSA